MTDASQTQAAPDAASEARMAALIGYALFVLAVVNGVTAIAGVVLAYIKRAEARGTPYESHFTNMIHVFWVSVAVAVLLMATILFGIGDVLQTIDLKPPVALLALVPLFFLASVGFAVWYLYRTVRGFVRALDGKPY